MVLVSIAVRERDALLLENPEWLEQQFAMEFVLTSC